jgi:uncharacterized protein
LAINGGKDVLVSARIAVPRLKASLATNAASKVIYFPALNHMMQTAKTGLMDEVKYIEETISPEVLDKIGRWLLK